MYIFRSVKKSIKKIKVKLKHHGALLFDHKPKVLVLVYHRVCPEVTFNPLSTIVLYEIFKKQIDAILEKYPIISLSDALKQCNLGKPRNQIQIVLTFDDGYVDNYEIVFPILKKKGISAVFFLTTDYVGKGCPLRDWKEVCGKNGVKYDPEKDRCIDWKEAKDMSDNGMEIGSHAVSHDSLTLLSSEEAGQEILKSKLAIEKNTGKPCTHFAFPFGSAKDYNDELIEKVRKTGFRSCLLNIHGYNRLNKDMFCFKRIIMDENTNLNYLLG